MPVFLILLILIIGVPLAEIYVLIEVGRSIGALPTIALLIALALLGSWVLRQQGLHTLATVQAALARAELPAAALLDGLVLLLAGALLLAPGFITDAVGLCFLLPPVRRWLAATFGRSLLTRTSRRNRHASRAAPHTLEGDFQVERER